MKPQLTARPLLLATILSLAALCRTEAITTSIYLDSFNRTGALDGTMPDLADTPGQAWIADPGVTTDGSQAFNPDTTTGGYLPVTIDPGHIYTLSADLMSIAQDSSWIGIGFSQTADPGGFTQNFNLSAGPWGLIRGDTSIADDQIFAGPGTTSPTDVVTGGSNTGFHHLSIQLDTTGVQWTATWSIDGTQVGSTYTYSSNPTLSYIGFNADTGFANLGGDVQNFSFTEGVSVIPEPGTAQLVKACALVFAGVHFYRRRKLRG